MNTEPGQPRKNADGHGRESVFVRVNPWLIEPCSSVPQLISGSPCSGFFRHNGYSDGPATEAPGSGAIGNVEIDMSIPDARTGVEHAVRPVIWCGARNSNPRPNRQHARICRDNTAGH